MPRAKSKLSINKQSDENELEFFSHEPDRLDEMVEGNPISENNPQVRGGRTGSRATALQAPVSYTHLTLPTTPYV